MVFYFSTIWHSIHVSLLVIYRNDEWAVVAEETLIRLNPLT